MAERLEVFVIRQATLAPRVDMINMQDDSELQSWTFAA